MADKRRPLILALDPVDAVEPLDAPADDATLDIPSADLTIDAVAAPSEPSAAERRRLTRAERAAARELSASPAPEANAEPAEAGPWLARFAYPIAALSAVTWMGALAAFVAGYERRAWAFDYAPFRLAIAAGLAVLPAVFILLSAYMIRQGARLAAEARRARSLSDDLSTPAMLAAAQAGGAAQAVREEVGRVKAVADEASRRMADLRHALSEESRLLTEAAGTAERSARTLGGRLQSERAELGGLASTLDAQATAAAEGLARQSRLVADASDLAQAQMAEAEAALTSRTADLIAAASQAERAASGAGDELGRQNGRLERLAAQLAEERDGLAAATEGLFANQDEMLARTESQRARLAAAAIAARDGAMSVVEAAEDGAGSLNALIAEAGSQLRTLTEAARREHASLAGSVDDARAAVEAETQEALERLRAAADGVRAAASSSAAALTAQAEAAGQGARTQVDELAQAAFEAGQRADQAFDARLAAARRAIDAQATLVEEAGLRAAARIEAGLGSAQAMLGEMEGLVAELESRLAKAPEEARARVEALRGAVEAGVEGVSAAARRAAADTEAVDAAFQDRVRKTYATLTDAVRVMGQAADAVAAQTPAPAPRAAPPPVAVPAREDEALFPTLRAMAFPEREVEREPMRIVVNGGGASRPAASEPAPAALRPAALAERPAAEPAIPALRTRLRLAPTAEDAEVRALFEAPAPRDEEAAPAEAASGGDSWSWKDLLGGMENEGPIDDEALAEQMLGEITGMGVDPGALLPRARIDEIARTVHAGEAGQAREAVRRLAPAAVRRLSRRVMTDRVLRGQADLYRRRYGDLLREAGRGDVEGAATQALLGSDPGRAWLLLEAAAADLH